MKLHYQNGMHRVQIKATESVLKRSTDSCSSTRLNFDLFPAPRGPDSRVLVSPYHPVISRYYSGRHVCGRAEAAEAGEAQRVAVPHRNLSPQSK